MTSTPALVIPWIEPLVWSVSVSVCVPTVPNDNVNWRKPLFRVPVTGVLAPPSLDVMRTRSPLGSGFQ